MPVGREEQNTKLLSEKYIVRDRENGAQEEAAEIKDPLDWMEGQAAPAVGVVGLVVYLVDVAVEERGFVEAPVDDVEVGISPRH